MQEHEYKARDKTVQKMSRDGLREENLRKKEEKRITGRDTDTEISRSEKKEELDFSKRRHERLKEEREMEQPEQSSRKPRYSREHVSDQDINSDMGEEVEIEGDISVENGENPKSAFRTESIRGQPRGERAYLETVADSRDLRKKKMVRDYAAKERRKEKETSREEKAAKRESARYRETSEVMEDSLDKFHEEIKGKSKRERVLKEQRKKVSRLSFGDEGDGMVHGAGIGIRNPASAVKDAAVTAAHWKTHEEEDENAAVEGAHQAELVGESLARKSIYMRERLKGRREESRRLKESVLDEAERSRLIFETAYGNEAKDAVKREAEKKKKSALQKLFQKKRYQKQYQAARQSKKVKDAAITSAQKFTEKAKDAVKMVAAQNRGIFATVAVFALIFVLIAASFTSCTASLQGASSAIISTSYSSTDEDIYAAENAYRALEEALNTQINQMESTHPDYDEYRYNLDAIGHDPFVLISYLSAVHTEFTASDMQSEIESLFEEMYELTLNPTTETRTRTVTDPETGEETEEEYTVTILEVTLTATDLGVVVAGHMNEEQKEIYALYTETHGLTQQFYTPLNLYWYSYVSSYYGYRINPVTGQEQFHRGVDIVVPTGTTVLAAMDGTVTTATYDASYGNYVVIEDSNGYCTKYAHMDTLNVSAGQTVTHGTTIGTTGNTGSSTGSHLHIECLYNGEYYNPLFYFDVGEGTLYGESPGGGGSPGNVIPPDSYDDATVQALMEEAARYLGYPYVWGGSSPSTSFDCSGFVCWVFTNSGVHNLPRTTAQGIYDQCTPVSAADAKAGDIIFFTGTYNSPGPVSHVGIYCGNGVMIHCGDPIKYASINTPYWQSHFYSFGRLN